MGIIQKNHSLKNAQSNKFVLFYTKFNLQVDFLRKIR